MIQETERINLFFWIIFWVNTAETVVSLAFYGECDPTNFSAGN